MQEGYADYLIEIPIHFYTIRHHGAWFDLDIDDLLTPAQQKRLVKKLRERLRYRAKKIKAEIVREFREAWEQDDEQGSVTFRQPEIHNIINSQQVRTELLRGETLQDSEIVVKLVNKWDLMIHRHPDEKHITFIEPISGNTDMWIQDGLETQQWYYFNVIENGGTPGASSDKIYRVRLQCNEGIAYFMTNHKGANFWGNNKVARKYATVYEPFVSPGRHIIRRADQRLYYDINSNIEPMVLDLLRQEA